MPDATTLVGNIKDLTSGNQKPARNVGQTLGKDAFLQLLVSQLKNQDPMKPMDDTNFISQMAQFSSLEQMQNLNKTMEAQQQFQDLTQASSMIGKFVSVQGAGDHAPIITGKVDEVRQAGGKVSVVVNGKEYDATEVTKVSGVPFTGSAAATTSTGTTSASSTKSTSAA